MTVVREITLRKMGGSVGATLPKDLADRFALKVGTTVMAVETEHGILLTPYDAEFARTIQAYEEGAAKYRNALRELA